MGGSFARTGIPLPVWTTAYNAANELTQWSTATLTYDANGNMLSDGTNSFVWDARNELSSMNGGTISFKYDAFGRRVAKTISGTTTSYLYDGANPVQELSGATVSANVLPGPGVDEYLMRTDSAGARSLLTDALRSTLALADSTAMVQTEYTYEPFGNTAVSGSASANPYQYAGRENDGTGLYFYRARYYSPMFGRFISEDPAGFRGVANMYIYAFDNPLSYVDPSGEWPWWLSLNPTKNLINQSNLDTDRQIEKDTERFYNPFLMKNCPGAVELAEINELVLQNIIVDVAVSGGSRADLVEALTEVATGEPSDVTGLATSALESNLESFRNYNNQKIDQLLKQASEEVQQAMKHNPCGYAKGCN